MGSDAVEYLCGEHIMYCSGEPGARFVASAAVRVSSKDVAESPFFRFSPALLMVVSQLSQAIAQDHERQVQELTNAAQTYKADYEAKLEVCGHYAEISVVSDFCHSVAIVFSHV